MAQSDKIRSALLAARKDGNVDAMKELGQMLVDTEREESSPSAGMGNFEAGLVSAGAGLESAWQGVKQLVGQGPTKEQQKEKAKLMAPLHESHPWSSGIGEFVGENVGLAVPGGAGAKAALMGARGLSATRAALAAAAGGGVGAGLAAESDAEAPWAGKAQQAALGSVLGPLVGGAVGAAVPAASRAVGGLSRAVRGVVDRAPGQLDAAAARNATRMIEQGIDDPAVALSRLQSYRPQDAVGGMTPGQITRDPSLLAIERAGKSVGDEANPFRIQEREGNKLRAEAMRRELPDATDVELARDATRTTGKQFETIKLLPGKDLLTTGATGRALDSVIDESVGPTMRTLEAIRADFAEAVRKSNASRNTKAIHSWRKSINDQISSANRRGDSALAGELESKLHPLNNALDAELGRLTGGEWNRVQSEFRPSALARKQAINEGKILTDFEGLAQDSQGNPLATSMAAKMRKMNAGTGLDRYGDEMLSPNARGLMGRVGDEANAIQAANAPDLGVRGSATALNLKQMQDMAARAGQSERGITGGDIGFGGAGMMALDPSTVGFGLAAKKLYNWRGDKLAQKTLEVIMQKASSPQEISAILSEMVKRKLIPPTTAQNVVQMLAEKLKSTPMAVGIGSAAGAQTNMRNSDV